MKDGDARRDLPMRCIARRRFPINLHALRPHVITQPILIEQGWGGWNGVSHLGEALKINMP